MKTYKVVFSSQSVLNDIPNSQTLFGSICTIISQTQGEETLNEYINSFINKEPLFVHSSMFLNGYLPMIKRSVFSLNEVNALVRSSNNDKKLTVLADTKVYKKLGLMSEGLYKKYIVTNEFDQLKSDIQNHKESFHIDQGIISLADEKSVTDSVVINMTRNGFSENGTDKSLFYTNAMYYPNGTEFCVYVKANKDTEYLKKIFNYLEYFGIGNRRTVGNNCFRLERIEEADFEQCDDYRLILSHYIPEDLEVEFEESNYVLSTSIYRSSKERGGGHISGEFTHVLEGSWLKMKEEKDYYGRIIETEADGKKIYHYGIGFSV